MRYRLVYLVNGVLELLGGSLEVAAEAYPEIVELLFEVGDVD